MPSGGWRTDRRDEHQFELDRQSAWNVFDLGSVTTGYTRGHTAADGSLGKDFQATATASPPLPTRPSTRSSTDPSYPSSSTSGPNGAGRPAMIAPILEDIAADHGDQLKVCQAERRRQPEHRATRYSVMSIPTLIVFPQWPARQADRRRPWQKPSCSRSSGNSCPLPGTDTRPARRGRARSAASSHRRWLSAGWPPAQGSFDAAHRGRGVCLSTPPWPATSVASATRPPGRHSSKRPGRLGDRLLPLVDHPTCAATTWPSLQACLARLGFDSGKVDGIFGPLTARRPADSNATVDSTSMVSAGR